MNAISDRLPLSLLVESDSRSVPERSRSGRRQSATADLAVTDRVLAKALRPGIGVDEGLLQRRINQAVEVRASLSITRKQVLDGVVGGVLMAGCICPALLMLSIAEQYELFLLLTIGVMLVSGVWGIGRKLLVVQLGFAKPQPARLVAALIVLASCAAILHV
ncbi:hypothetical protein LBMAG53_33730 [Planctomycetota bacterium]|nr:hypothetical protein LBMAG53_33730 [Planctomycetota bacterium]